MSVTFWCPDAPRKQVPCRFCIEWREKGWVEPHENCDQFCNGTTEESEAPEINLSNGDVGAILRLLGWTDQDDYLGGECDPATLRQRVFRASNGDVGAATAEPYELEPGHAGVAVVKDEDGIDRIERRGPRVISFGYTDEQVRDRLERLDTLARWAQEHGHQVAWGWRGLRAGFQRVVVLTSTPVSGVP